MRLSFSTGFCPLVGCLLFALTTALQATDNSSFQSSDASAESQLLRELLFDKLSRYISHQLQKNYEIKNIELRNMDYWPMHKLVAPAVSDALKGLTIRDVLVLLAACDDAEHGGAPRSRRDDRPDVTREIYHNFNNDHLNFAAQEKLLSAAGINTIGDGIVAISSKLNIDPSDLKKLSVFSGFDSGWRRDMDAYSHKATWQDISLYINDKPDTTRRYGLELDLNTYLSHRSYKMGPISTDIPKIISFCYSASQKDG